MNSFTANWIIPTITSLIASVIATCIGMWIRENNISTKTMKGVANTVALKTARIVLEVGQYTLAFWCLSLLLTPLLTEPGPPSRWDVFGISFWTFWICIIFLRLLAGKAWPIGKLPD